MNGWTVISQSPTGPPRQYNLQEETPMSKPAVFALVIAAGAVVVGLATIAGRKWS